MDIRVAFLHEDIGEQPNRFIILQNEHLVYRLEQCLYGLKSPFQCYKKFDRFFSRVSSSVGKISASTHTDETGSPLILVSYIADILIAGKQSY